MTNKAPKFFKEPKKSKQKEQKPLENILSGGITALIGTALFLETAKLIGK